MVLVSSAAPNRLAKVAEIGAAKNTQTCAPFPERDRSSAAGTFIPRQDSTKACASRFHDSPSKSAAKNQQVSSASRGYPPTVIFPERCWNMTSSVSGSNCRVALSCFLLSDSGTLDKAFQSRRLAGAYPDFPSAPSQCTAYTSSRPRNSERNRAILSATDGSARGSNTGVSATTEAVPPVGPAGSPSPSPRASNFRRRAFSSRRRSHSAVVLANCSERLSNSATTGIIAELQGDASGGPPHLHFRLR